MVNKEHKEHLTNEYLGKKFISQFELVNHAIKVAEHLIHSGRGSAVKTDLENPALISIAEIAEGKDILTEQVRVDEVEITTSLDEVFEEEEVVPAKKTKKSTAPKRSLKIVGK